jgi:putative transposase
MHLIDDQYTRTPFYGSPRMTIWLRSQGYGLNHKRVARLMQLMGLQAIYPKPKSSSASVAQAGPAVYPYLLRHVTIERVNQVWSTDITYVRLRDGWIHLVAILDWFSRYVLAWQVSITMEADFCVETLERALRQARPQICNSDQGSQFTSREFSGC